MLHSDDPTWESLIISMKEEGWPDWLIKYIKEGNGELSWGHTEYTADKENPIKHYGIIWRGEFG
jgi:hypothetical protein